MEVPMSKIMVGFNTDDGMGAIIPVMVRHDMGDHGRASAPVRLDLAGNNFELSYVGKKSGNLIYREVKNEE